MLEAYFAAFENFLQTGNRGPLTRFTDVGANPAFLNVYRNGYLKTCTDNLAASYPAVCCLVGEDYFHRLARAYVEAHPPTTGTLVGYGSHFPAFLQSRSNEHGLTYLADAATIDAAWLDCNFAEDVVALSPVEVDSMGSRGDDLLTVRVRLTPTTRLVCLKHHIAETWAVIREQGALTRAVGLRDGTNTAMLWRLDGKIHIKELDPGESAFLSTLSGVATLETAAVSAFAVDESFDLESTFAALLQNQVLQLEGLNE